MPKETKCPNCGADRRWDYMRGVNKLRWECGNNEDLIESGDTYPDECRIRKLEDRYTKLQSAWIGLTTELHLRASVGFDNADEVSDVIHRWEDELHA